MSASLDVPAARLPAAADVVYPEDDGQPTADNTLQFQWMVTMPAAFVVLLGGGTLFAAASPPQTASPP